MPRRRHHTMYARILRKATQIRRFTITNAAPSGWDVREEQDSRIIRAMRYHDWHRVERARMDFAREVLALRAGGWEEA